MQQLYDIKAKISQTKVYGKDIEIEEIPPSKSVIINNIDESKRKNDYLRLYFSDPECGRGVNGFKHFDLLDNGQVVVHFEDSECKLS